MLAHQTAEEAGGSETQTVSDLKPITCVWTEETVKVKVFTDSEFPAGTDGKKRTQKAGRKLAKKAPKPTFAE